MNELKIFENEQFGRIRTAVVNGEPYFVGKDVAEILGYADPNKAIAMHVDDEDKLNDKMASSLGQRGGWFINESGLYSLVLKSQLPQAKQFKRWVTADVLPTIRKTGGYVNNDDAFIKTYLPYADDATKVLFQSTLATVRSLNAKIEADRPKVIFADSVETSHTSILVGVLAKILKQNGVSIGQNRLFDWLRRNGYLTRDNTPTQRSMELGLFEIKERTVNNPDGSVRITKTTLVTGKGQTYLVNKFLG